jgi:hypothetical protein
MLLRRHAAAAGIPLKMAAPSLNGGAVANMGDPAIDRGGPSNRTYLYVVITIC